MSLKPPTYPHLDLTPDWTPTTPNPTFFSFIISSIRGSHPPDPHPITPSTFQFSIASILGSQSSNQNIPFFQFHNKFNSWFTSDRPTHPGPTPITLITSTCFSFTITSIRGSHPPNPQSDHPRLFSIFK